MFLIYILVKFEWFFIFFEKEEIEKYEVVVGSLKVVMKYIKLYLFLVVGGDDISFRNFF